jgi:CheY-like chemotaxis protein
MSRIVVIEEDTLMRELLMEWLRGEGYSVRAAAPGEAGSPADLVIVDVYKPRDEGAARLRAIKAAQRLRTIKAAHPQVPLIAISGQFRPGLAGSCTAAETLGVRQVIAKPFSQTDLLAAVHGVIGPAR